MRVLTMGTFDLFHQGHAYLLRRAAEHGVLFAGVNSDRFVSEYKGRMPAEPEEMRLRKVAAFRHVQRALLNDGPGVELVQRIRPSMIVIGGDWLEHDYLKQIDVTRQQLEDLGCDVLFVTRIPGHSTTALRAVA